MNSVSDVRRRRLLASALVLPWFTPAADAQVHGPHDAATQVLPFDASSWEHLLRAGPRPAAYVFTTTYCSTCPAVFELLHDTLVAARRKVELAAVVMDVQGERARVHAHHYRGMTRLYAFDGFEPEIRHAVDPKWRNITPYVVLLDARGHAQRVVGPPSPAQLRTWLA